MWDAAGGGGWLGVRRFVRALSSGDGGDGGDGSGSVRVCVCVRVRTCLARASHARACKLRVWGVRCMYVCMYAPARACTTREHVRGCARLHGLPGLLT